MAGKALELHIEGLVEDGQEIQNLRGSLMSGIVPPWPVPSRLW
jgi:hypothetical protein